MLDYHQLCPYVPEHLHERVSTDNQSFLLERNLFDPELQRFLLNVLDTIGIAEGRTPTLTDVVQQRALAQVLMRYTFDLLARAYDNKNLECFVARIKLLLQLSPDSGYMFLQEFFFSRVQKTVDLLLVCPETKTRAMIAKLLSAAFNSAVLAYNLTL